MFFDNITVTLELHYEKDIQGNILTRSALSHWEYGIGTNKRFFWGDEVIVAICDRVKVEMPENYTEVTEGGITKVDVTLASSINDHTDNISSDPEVVILQKTARLEPLSTDQVVIDSMELIFDSVPEGGDDIVDRLYIQWTGHIGSNAN